MGATLFSACTSAYCQHNFEERQPCLLVAQSWTCLQATHFCLTDTSVAAGSSIADMMAHIKSLGSEVSLDRLRNNDRSSPPSSLSHKRVFVPAWSGTFQASTDVSIDLVRSPKYWAHGCCVDEINLLSLAWQLVPISCRKPRSCNY